MFKYIITLFILFFTLSVQASNYDRGPNFNKRGWEQNSSFIAQVVKEADGDLLEIVIMISLESNFKSNAVNPSTKAAGYMQFMPRTWRYNLKTFGPKYGLSMNTPSTDPRANLLMAIEHGKDNRRYLERRLGRDVSTYEVQMAHFLGQGGSAKMIRSANNRLARDVLPAAAIYNKSYFYKPNGTPRTVGEFKAFYKNRLDRARDTYLAETYLLAFKENLHFKDHTLAKL